MTDNPEFILDDGADGQDASKLRQLLKQAHATLKQKDQELEALRSAEVQRTAKATWDELKVPDRIRKLYQGEQTPEAMKQWFEEYRDIFNVEVAEEQPGEPQLTPEQVAQQAAAAAFQEASSLGSDALNSGLDAVNAKVQAAKGLKGADLAAAKAEVYKALGFPEH